jgi:hypothetical protein
MPIINIASNRPKNGFELINQAQYTSCSVFEFGSVQPDSALILIVLSMYMIDYFQFLAPNPFMDLRHIR